MPFEPGQSGNPEGTQKYRRFIGALDRAIAQDDGKKLRFAAEKLLELAAEGDLSAINALADRLDGKPHQSVAVGNPDGTALFSEIARTIIDAAK